MERKRQAEPKKLGRCHQVGKGTQYTPCRSSRNKNDKEWKGIYEEDKVHNTHIVGVPKIIMIKKE